MTASVPAKSTAKCTALAPSAALPSLRAARAEAVARAASITSTSTSSATAYQVARTSPAAAAQAQDGRDRDPGRGQHEDRGLAQRREVLRLAVAIGMLRVGRAVGDAHAPTA